MLVFLRITVIAAASWIASAAVIYQIAIWQAPPRSADGHPVMPIGQVFVAFVGASLIALAIIIVLTVLHYRRRRALTLELEARPDPGAARPA